MNFGHIADRPRLDNFHRTTQAILGRALVTHLGADAVFFRDLAEQVVLEHGAGEWLLNVDVLLGTHRHRGRQRVHVVGRADREGIDGLHQFGIVEQLAEVRYSLGFRPLFELRTEVILVDVAQADDFHEFARLVDVARTFAADADACNAQFLVRTVGFGHRERGAGKEIPETTSGRELHEPPT